MGGGLHNENRVPFKASLKGFYKGSMIGFCTRGLNN